MAKITVKAVTRLQKFLAAIAGDGVAPNPITDKEKLLHNIAENVNNGGGSGGGGVLVVNRLTVGDGDDTSYVLDKTWQEIYDADYPVINSRVTNGKSFMLVNDVFESAGVYYVEDDVANTYAANTANDYPSMESQK